MINQIESGRCKPNYETAKRIFEILLSMESSASIKAGDICNKNLITIQSEESLSVAIHKMRDHSISQLPVFDGSRRLVGILTEDNLAKIIIEHSDRDIYLVKIVSVMEPPPPLVDVSMPAKALVSLVRFAKCVLVSEKGTVIGIITLTDTLIDGVCTAVARGDVAFGWARVLDQYGFIFVSAARSGNDETSWLAVSRWH